MDTIEFREQLKLRTKAFALRVIRLYQSLPKNTESQVIGKQLLRSATSVAANYRAACRSRSNADFYSKICIVVEEAEESLFLVGNTYRSRDCKNRIISRIVSENEELRKIMVIARKNSEKK